MVYGSFPTRTNRDHLIGLAVQCMSHCGAAHLLGLPCVDRRNEFGHRSLDGPRPVVADSNVEVACDERRQVSARAFVVLIAEIVDVEGSAVTNQRSAMPVSHILLDDSHCEPELAVRVLNHRKDARPVERHFRCDNYVGGVSYVLLSENGRRGQPTGVSASDLDQR